MGAQSSSQRDGKSQEDASVSASASGGELSAEVKVLQDSSKPLEKNGQISSLTSLNGHSEDNTLAEVGQPDGVSVAQKEEAPDNTETSPVEGSPQINGEKMDNETPEANDISSAEEKTTEEKADDANKVGFKKIFSIAGLKFTLKKDKSDETDPVKLLTVKDKEGEEVGETEEPAKDKEAEEETAAEEKEAETDPPTTEAEVTKDTDATAEAQPEEAAAEEVKEEGEEKEAEATSSPRETGVSSFRKFFLVSLFSNLRKKSSIKKTKEEEEAGEAPVVSAAEEKEDADQETKKEDNVTGQETQDGKCMDEEKAKEEDIVTEQETKEAPETRVEDKSEPKEETPSTPEEAKSDAAPEEKVEATSPTESTADQTKPEEQKAEAPAEATAEAEQLSSHEKSKVHGSPLKKLFTGSGLKKLSTKRQKHKKDSEAKPADSGEQAAEHLPSIESEEAPKANNGPSSPETSGEHEEVNQHESSQETDGELASDGEKKKDSVIASFRKLVTPKKHAKRSSDSEDEGTGDKPPKSATLSSSESAPLAETKGEEEAKEEKASEDEPKTENTEKLTSSTEETKKKMDTSVSWEALMCMGGPKKRTRKTSDSDDEATKAEEEIPAAAAEEKQERKTEDVDVPPQSPESEEVTPAPEPLSTPPVRESPWSTLKRLVMSKHKTKGEEKPEEPADSEAHKDESSFSLKKLFYGGKKKVAEKQSSTDQGSGEEDSDTPAVVPLSEYEGHVKAVEEVPEEPAVFQIKVSADDRSPSWIPAIVENIDDQHDPLSDIPEEAENSATPKSIDTIPEGEIEEQGLLPVGPRSTGRRLSTAEVKPIAPAPDAATSPVPQGPKTESATEVVTAIEAQVSEIPIQSSVTVQHVPVEVASAETEKEPETEEAESSANAVLELHVKEETVAICTGLQTDEIASVTLEQPVEPTVECSAPLSDAANVEIAVEEKPEGSGKAEATEDPVLQAHVHQVQTLELEPVAEKLQSEVVDVQVATESYEPGIEKVAVVSTENSEVIQPTMLKQNSPKSVVVDAIAPTPEAVVCTRMVEVAEMTVEIKEVRMELEQLAASQESTPVGEASQVVAKEVSSARCDTKENAEGFKTAAPAVVTSEGNAVVIETVVLVAPEKEHQTKENDVEKASEKIEKATEEVHLGSELVTHSVVIAEAVITEAVDKVLEDASHLKKSAAPPAATETPVKATATTQDEIEITAECVVITDTPVPVVCEQPAATSLQALFVAMEVTETVPLEVTHNIVEKEEEEKPKQSLKMAEQVKVSEGTIIEEEVTEMVEEGKGQEENGSQKVLEIHMPTQVILQSADVVEEKPAEVETTVELDGDNTNATADKPSRQNSLPELPEEPQETASGEDAAEEPEAGQKTSGKCAEVMAQVIEEAVKEIEPVSMEITAAS
ncbi:A-kinase anchor protein 12b isoform X1 [Nothobranchius furzeri]|uniref:A kinase (PRKA) anchor protein (Gravin) 12b n=1 Tax=Nothobranchius furzeri TaxID=105023 RepID=A0A1A8AJN0_NOTFU|nr:transcript variant X1 [Nothobranchius furzeri]